MDSLVPILYIYSSSNLRCTRDDWPFDEFTSLPGSDTKTFYILCELSNDYNDLTKNDKTERFAEISSKTINKITISIVFVQEIVIKIKYKYKWINKNTIQLYDKLSIQGLLGFGSIQLLFVQWVVYSTNRPFNESSIR